jgi:hypothetical protein
MKKVLFSALIVLASAGSLLAQSTNEYSKRIEIGWHPYSFLRQDGVNQHGGSISAAYMMSDRFAYVADVSMQQAGNGVVNAAYTFGPRLYRPLTKKLTGFAEVLAGGAHRGTLVVNTGAGNVVTPGRNGFAVAAGGGVDMAIRPWFSWRVAQVDYNYLHVAGSNANGVRIQTGGVFRVGSPRKKK